MSLSLVQYCLLSLKLVKLQTLEQCLSTLLFCICHICNYFRPCLFSFNNGLHLFDLESLVTAGLERYLFILFILSITSCVVSNSHQKVYLYNGFSNLEAKTKLHKCTKRHADSKRCPAWVKIIFFSEIHDFYLTVFSLLVGVIVHPHSGGE